MISDKKWMSYYSDASKKELLNREWYVSDGDGVSVSPGQVKDGDSWKIVETLSEGQAKDHYYSIERVEPV